MKIYLLAFSLLVSVACSSDRGSRHASGSKPAEGDAGGATNPAKTDDGDRADTEAVNLPLLPESGSSMRLLPARALNAYYQNVFKKNTFGYRHCVKDKPRNYSDCFDSIFTADERPAMGTFDLGTPRMNRRPSNVNPAANLTLNYTRTLRAALSRECSFLVETELANLKANNVSSNILIKAQKPSAADIDAFMRKILGLDGTKFKLPIDADGYAKDFEAAVAATMNADAGMKNGFTGLCIALAMDPMVFLY